MFHSNTRVELNNYSGQMVALTIRAARGDLGKRRM